MPDRERIPVTVVTGFLGAGKTTLVNRWLSAAPRGEVAVIVNEYGDVGIDGELLAARAQVLVEITGGCVCCTTQAELVRALDEIAASKTPPKRILIETSGAASPAGVLVAIARGGRHDAFALDGVIAVADATRIDTLGDHDLAFEQLGYADIVVFSRADACGPERLAHAREIVGPRNGAAVFVAAAHGEVITSDVAPASATLENLLELRRTDDFTPANATHAAHAVRAPPSHVYESVSLTLDGEVDGERFADFVELELAQIAGRLFRTKGILGVAGVEERMIVQGVADSVEVTFGDPWGHSPRTCRLVIVGFGLDRAALVRTFAACAST